MSIAVLGEALIDFIMNQDGSYRPYLGGSPYNVAIGLARQGCEVSYLSPLSSDKFGDQFAKVMLKEGVQMPINRRSLWPTSLALVTLTEEGLPSYRLYREGIADKDTEFEEIKANLPDKLQLFHTGSLAITPSQLPKIRNLFELFHSMGVQVSIDLNIRLGASIDKTAYLNGVRSLLPLADIVKASDEDLLALKLNNDARRSAELAYEEMKSGILILTEGSGGVVVYTPNAVVQRKAHSIVNVADTVGAGDTFHSAFLAYLCRHSSIAGPISNVDITMLGNAADYACAAAAINVSRVGCSPPTQSETERFIASTELK